MKNYFQNALNKRKMKNNQNYIQNKSMNKNEKIFLMKIILDQMILDLGMILMKLKRRMRLKKMNANIVKITNMRNNNHKRNFFYLKNFKLL